MAGLYADDPAYRLAYDFDGTKVFLINATLATITELTQTQKQYLNDESSISTATDLQINSSAQATHQTHRLAFLFPDTVNLISYKAFFSTRSGAVVDISTLQSSTDTTNGSDGTWTNMLTTWTNSGTIISPNYRQSFPTLSTANTNIKAVRFNLLATNSAAVVGTALTMGHIGLYANPVGTNRQLAFWQPSTDAEVGPAYFDFGDVTQSTNATKTFRIKNLSTYTANSVVVSTSVLTEVSPTISSQHLLSLDNSTWSSSVTLPDAIASGAISPVIYFKRNTASNAALGTYSGRLKAVAGTWSA